MSIHEELEFYLTEDLTKALLSRFEHAAVVGMQPGAGPGSEHEYFQAWVGNRHTVHGLLGDLQHKVLMNEPAPSQDEADDGHD